MTTVSQLITLALKDAGIVGVGQTPLNEDMNDAFTRLNYMLAQWAVTRFYVWHYNEYFVTATGQNSYTVGPSGNIVVPVIPTKIESAFTRQLVNSPPNQVDWPLTIIPSKEDWDRVALKQLSAFPRYLWYDYSFENGSGTAYFWPVPQANLYEMHISCMEQLQQFTGLTQVINMPLQYFACLHYNLAKRLRVAYAMPPDQELNILALDAINILKDANLQIPLLRMPVELLRHAIYDPYSDQVY